MYGLGTVPRSASYADECHGLSSLGAHLSGAGHLRKKNRKAPQSPSRMIGAIAMATLVVFGLYRSIHAHLAQSLRHDARVPKFLLCTVILLPHPPSG